ncbi:MAG: zinc metallopeptidase [Bacteroidota bacterium]|jgi:Zn-dependent membrane protease YugP|nr:zinc metallopeptidase [Bacteroidota bacterium]
MFDPILLIISVVFIGIGMVVSNRLKTKFAHYSQEPLSSGLSGKDIAVKMLNAHGIYDVNVISVDGSLSDHYNPANKTVNLSRDVYHGRHVASAAVAAHECGHAVQHATAYQWLTLRSTLVPAVQLSSTLMNFLTFGIALVAFMIPTLTNTMLLIFIILQSIITLFSIVTLPVEVDASKRALVWLDQSGITRGQENADARDALKWAAYTYFISALGSIATLAYYIWKFMGNRRD